MNTKPRIATVWLGGCSGCHMSFLDIDERLIDLAEAADVVFSPIADVKTFPINVDIAIVEGAVSDNEHLEFAHTIRKNSRLVVSLGDCAVSGNVTALRNAFTPEEMLQRAYVELADTNPQIPGNEVIMTLLPQARPLHEVIKVDAFVHGCPPTADQIWTAVTALLKGEKPEQTHVFLRYG